FQAEDGIRDFHVTGVQTCALPISLHWHWIGPLMAIIVVGGLGSIPGAAIAALLLGVLRVMAELLPGVTPTLAQTIFYLALFLTLMVRPQGFFGGRLAQRF